MLKSSHLTYTSIQIYFILLDIVLSIGCIFSLYLEKLSFNVFLKTGFRPALYIKQQPFPGRCRMHAIELPKENTWRTEHNTMLCHGTPNLDDNALGREKDAMRRCCRVHCEQMSSPGALTRREEPQWRLQEERGTRGRRHRRHQGTELSLVNSPVPPQYL